ncbi:hypothetical protein MTO96_001452 [Rhipicephalus appendiculatus]
MNLNSSYFRNRRKRSKSKRLHSLAWHLQPTNPACTSYVESLRDDLCPNHRYTDWIKTADQHAERLSRVKLQVILRNPVTVNSIDY